MCRQAIHFFPTKKQIELRSKKYFLNQEVLPTTSQIETMKSFEAALAELTTANNAVEVEAALENVTSFSTGEPGSKTELMNKIEAIQSNDHFNINAKLRRKMKRLHETLAAMVEEQKQPVKAASSSSSAQASKNKKNSSEEPDEGVNNIVLDKDLASTITAVRSAHNANELEEALNGVRPGVGTCNSRRSLKRAIEQVLTKEEIDTSMNAKVRRRVTRAFKSLAPGAGEAIEQARKEEEAAAKSRKQDKDAKKPSKAIVPYIVFVGQLDFLTSGEEVTQYLRSKGIEGSIKTRLLKDKETGNSKGMAFVELETAAEMYKCVALHHSILNGRMINIEKSCGGKNKDVRKEKLTEKRHEQVQKLNESVERLLDTYATQGVIQADKLGSEFEEKIFRLGPHVLAKVSSCYFTSFLLLLLC